MDESHLVERRQFLSIQMLQTGLIAQQDELQTRLISSHFSLSTFLKMRRNLLNHCETYSVEI